MASFCCWKYLPSLISSTGTAERRGNSLSKENSSDTDATQTPPSSTSDSVVERSREDPTKVLDDEIMAMIFSYVLKSRKTSSRSTQFCGIRELQKLLLGQVRIDCVSRDWRRIWLHNCCALLKLGPVNLDLRLCRHQGAVMQCIDWVCQHEIPLAGLYYRVSPLEMPMILHLLLQCPTNNLTIIHGDLVVCIDCGRPCKRISDNAQYLPNNLQLVSESSPFLRRVTTTSTGENYRCTFHDRAMNWEERNSHPSTDNIMSMLQDAVYLECPKIQELSLSINGIYPGGDAELMFALYKTMKAQTNLLATMDGEMEGVGMITFQQRLVRW